MLKIVVIDYNMGNLFSVRKAVEHVAPPASKIEVSSDPKVIMAADRIVFPGQGAARDCIQELQARGLNEVVREVALTKPFLGVCMGMQVLLEHSTENGGVDCLGIFQGEVKHFNEVYRERLKTPQMGWNEIYHTQENHPLWTGIADGARFYFVHSYHAVLKDKALASGETEYGIRYPSALAKDNIFAIQAHPEKSAADGLKLLENFMNWRP
ncbi:imidazole glycerol phosphate synthase subunit HisH [Thiolinea disciformis]|uniref:imidazole glycerol phosphate synthase subunit HisH n=1 Tax=Thiolinea disciformis TaxID=125614 RepID=UPI0003668364|nr:imidazole glycerol phosphate synthase subunit HisH [Thiolinea disciformis]